MRKIIIYLLIPFLICAPLYAVPSEAYRTYLRAMFASRSGDLKYALKEYQHVIDLDKDAVSVYRDLAVIYWQMGDKEKAFSAAGLLEKLSSDNIENQIFLGNFYSMAGQNERSIKAWQSALKLDPENEIASMSLAALEIESDPAKASAYWKDFIEKQPDSPEGYFQLGIALEKSGEFESSKEAFLKVLSLKPDSAEAHLFLAQIYEKQQQTLSAAQEFERALEINPDNFTVLTYLGGLYYRNKNYPLAQDKFSKAYKLNPRDTSVNFWLGLLAEGKKDYRSAVKYFEFLRASEESVMILSRLSYYYSALKENEKAVECLEKISKLEPSNSGTYYILGLTYYDLKKYGLAEKNLLKAINIKPDLEEAHFNLGVIYDSRGDFRKAEQYLNKAVELNPKNATALNYLGYSYADKNIKLETAQSLILRALEISPENGAFIDSLGWLYFRQGKFDLAEKELLRSSAKVSDPVIFEHLGDIQMALNKYDDAWDSYTKALKLNPNNRKLRNKTKLLENKVLPRTLQKKVLNRAIANYLQLTSLQSGVIVDGSIGFSKARNAGFFQYKRPSMWRLDILGNFFAPNFVIIKNGDIKTFPPSDEEAFAGAGREILINLGDILNSSLLESFNSDAINSRLTKDSIYYEYGNKSISIDLLSGTLKTYEEKGRIKLVFRRHNLIEGLFIPAEIDARLGERKISVKISLSNTSINEPIADSNFSIEAK